MVLVRIAHLLATILLVSEAYSQMAGLAGKCGPSTMTPTGPIIPVGQFVVPAVIKPLVTPCKPGRPAKPTPPQPTSDKSCCSGAFDDLDDDEDNFDRLIYLLKSNILDKKSRGSNSSGCKGTGTEGRAGSGDSARVNASEDGYEYSYPRMGQLPSYGAAGASYPAGATAGASAAAAPGALSAGGDDCPPEINLIFRPFIDSCQDKYYCDQ